MQEILVDCSQLVTEDFVEKLDNFLVAFHCESPCQDLFLTRIAVSASRKNIKWEENQTERAAQRKMSGWLGQHIRHRQVIRPASLPQNLTGRAGAAATLGANSELFAKLAHGIDTAISGFTDLAVGYPMAEADVHDVGPCLIESY